MSIEIMKQALEALEDAAQCVQDNYLPDQMGHDWDDTITTLRTAIEQAEKRPCKYPKCPYPCPDLPDCKDAERHEHVGKWMGDCVEWTANPYKFKKGQPLYTTPPAAPVQEPPTDEQIIDVLLKARRTDLEASGIDTEGLRQEGVSVGWFLPYARAVIAAFTPPAAPVQEPVTVSEGWKLVPIEPTDTMLTALANVGVPHCVRPGGVTAIDAYGLNNVWRAMIALTPEPPAAQRQWVGLTPDERRIVINEWDFDEGKPDYLCRLVEAKLREKNGGQA